MENVRIILDYQTARERLAMALQKETEGNNDGVWKEICYGTFCTQTLKDQLWKYLISIKDLVTDLADFHERVIRVFFSYHVKPTPDFILDNYDLVNSLILCIDLDAGHYIKYER